MYINIFYFLFLLLIIFCLFSVIKSNMKHSPKKIRMYITIVGILTIISYIGMFILPFLNEQGIILYLTPLVYFKYLGLLLFLIPVIYIFLKEPNINFNLSYINMIILILMYIGVNVFLKSYLLISQNYGFVINLYKETGFTVGYIAVLGIYLLFVAMKIDTKYGDKKALWWTIIAIVITILELSLKIMGIYPFPYALIGDGLIVSLLMYCMNGFRKMKKIV